MTSGVSVVWFITWSLWAAVVTKDFRREPRDVRRLVSLAALVLLAIVTRDSLREADLRFALLGGLAAAVLIVWTIADFRTARTTKALAEWAGRNDFECVALKPQRTKSSLPDALASLTMFTNGRFPVTRQLLKRADAAGKESLIFRHSIHRPAVWYDISGMEAYGTVVAIHRPGIWLPRFQIRPVGLLPWMDGGIVGDPVPVPSGSSFSKSYRLGGDEPRNLRAMFTDELLAKIAEKSGWMIEGEGEWLAAIYFDRSDNLMSLKTSTLRTVSTENLEEFVREADAVLDRIADRGHRGDLQGVGAA